MNAGDISGGLRAYFALLLFRYVPPLKQHEFRCRFNQFLAHALLC
jgi:hypothetical protein